MLHQIFQLHIQNNLCLPDYFPRHKHPILKESQNMKEKNPWRLGNQFVF